jgi:hypothetical protein
MYAYTKTITSDFKSSIAVYKPFQLYLGVVLYLVDSDQKTP